MTKSDRSSANSSERRRRAEVVRLIVTTREKFPHSPRLMNALRRVLRRYTAAPPVRSTKKHKH